MKKISVKINMFENAYKTIFETINYIKNIINPDAENSKSQDVLPMKDSDLIYLREIVVDCNDNDFMYQHAIDSPV